ncbi:guanylate kinase [Immersiella caudata]|uniref:Guanylate kinase n=1 Tax=Immersiella caudata TaxID=314043 RepID=A0AA39WS07_9PEZI|nr:guanylate kinase [Immersiella caudata]
MRSPTTTTLLRALHTAVKMPALPPQRKPIVISGPSGVGKGTLYNLLFERNPDTFVLSVSHTTRGPRPGEQDGEHYHFVTKDAFLALKEQGGFVESAQFGDNLYGTSKQTIEEQGAKGKIVVLDIEMEGVKQIKATGFPARYVFIAPPSEEVLEKRLRGRGTDKEESILKRLAQAKLELEFAKTPGVHDKIIVNNDLEEAYKELVDFVYAPEA